MSINELIAQLGAENDRVTQRVRDLEARVRQLECFLEDIEGGLGNDLDARIDAILHQEPANHEQLSTTLGLNHHSRWSIQ